MRRVIKGLMADGLWEALRNIRRVASLESTDLLHIYKKGDPKSAGIGKE